MSRLHRVGDTVRITRGGTAVANGAVVDAFRFTTDAEF
jgi:hypothetical protein